MANALFTLPEIKNEPVLNYAAGSSERKALDSVLTELLSKKIDFRVQNIYIICFLNNIPYINASNWNVNETPRAINPSFKLQNLNSGNN